MSPDEPSLGELGRLIQALRGDVRDDMANISSRLDRLVSADVYAAEKAALEKDISDLSKDVDRLSAKQQQDINNIHEHHRKETDRVTQTRRWLIATVIVPLFGIIVPLLVALKGAKS